MLLNEQFSAYVPIDMASYAAESNVVEANEASIATILLGNKLKSITP